MKKKRIKVFRLLMGVLMLLIVILLIIAIIAGIYGNMRLLNFCLPLSIFCNLITLGYLGSRTKNKKEEKESEK